MYTEQPILRLVKTDVRHGSNCSQCYFGTAGAKNMASEWSVDPCALCNGDDHFIRKVYLIKINDGGE